MGEVCDRREGPGRGATVDEGEWREGKELETAKTVADCKGTDFGGKVEGSDGDGVGRKLLQWFQLSRIVDKVGSIVEACCGGRVEEGRVEGGRGEEGRGGGREGGGREGGGREGGG